MTSSFHFFTYSHISKGNCVIIQFFVCEFKTPIGPDATCLPRQFFSPNRSNLRFIYLRLPTFIMNIININYKLNIIVSDTVTLTA